MKQNPISIFTARIIVYICAKVALSVCKQGKRDERGQRIIAAEVAYYSVA